LLQYFTCVILQIRRLCLHNFRVRHAAVVALLDFCNFDISSRGTFDCGLDIAKAARMMCKIPTHAAEISAVQKSQHMKARNSFSRAKRYNFDPQSWHNDICRFRCVIQCILDAGLVRPCQNIVRNFAAKLNAYISKLGNLPKKRMNATGLESEMKRFVTLAFMSVSDRY
jgi:hypothetical protein